MHDDYDAKSVEANGLKKCILQWVYSNVVQSMKIPKSPIKIDLSFRYSVMGSERILSVLQNGRKNHNQGP